MNAKSMHQWAWNIAKDALKPAGPVQKPALNNQIKGATIVAPFIFTQKHQNLILNLKTQPREL